MPDADADTADSGESRTPGTASAPDTTVSHEPQRARTTGTPNDTGVPDETGMARDPGVPDETGVANATGVLARVRRVITKPTVLAVTAGLLLAASMPPWGWWPLAFAGIAFLDRLLADTSWHQRLWRGSVVGWALFTPTIFWIIQLTAPGYAFTVVFYGLLVGAFSIAVPPRAGRSLGLVGAWVLCESLRSAWPFGGIPLSLLAVSQVAGPLGAIARVGGVLAIAGVTVAIGVAVSAAFGRHYRKAAIAGGAALAVLLLALVAPSGTNTGEALDIAFVQGGGDQGTRAINTDRRKVFERHLEASEEVPAGMDLVLWPENVVDTDGEVQDSKEGRELQALARGLDAPLSIGTVEGVSDTEFRNSQQVLDADGNWGDRYEKVQRVPFGEFVPFRSLIEQVAPDTLATRDATVSTQSGLIETDAGPLATAISWEVFFGHRTRAAVQAGGELIYNPTNGSTYTGTLVQTQQIASSRLRAIETGRWLVQVAPTGFSAYISPTGEVFQRTGTGERAVEVRSDVPMRTGQTWYVRYGDTPARLAAVLLVAGGWALDLRSRRGAAAN